MRIDIITVLPELIQGFMQESIVGRAQKKGLVEIHIHNLRDYTLDKWRRVDDGHYKGIDYRIREHLITKEVSIGDYVLTGGELAAAVMTDAIVRILPGAIGDEQSALSDSFQDNLLAAPVYTRPAEYKGWKVPEVLLSGNERLIKEWELQQSLERTQRLRPDLLKGEIAECPKKEKTKGKK